MKQNKKQRFKWRSLTLSLSRTHAHTLKKLGFFGLEISYALRKRRFEVGGKRESERRLALGQGSEENLVFRTKEEGAARGEKRERERRVRLPGGEITALFF